MLLARSASKSYRQDSLSRAQLSRSTFSKDRSEHAFLTVSRVLGVWCTLYQVMGNTISSLSPSPEISEDQPEFWYRWLRLQILDFSSRCVTVTALPSTTGQVSTCVNILSSRIVDHTHSNGGTQWGRHKCAVLCTEWRLPIGLNLVSGLYVSHAGSFHHCV